MQIERSSSYPQAERVGRDSTQESMSGVTITERAEAETWENISKEKKKKKKSTRTDSTANGQHNAGSAKWKEKFKQTDRALTESRRQLGLAQKGAADKGQRLDAIQAQMKDQKRDMEKVIAERNSLRAGMVEKDRTLADIQVQLAHWRRKTQEATAQAHHGAASFRKMMQD